MSWQALGLGSSLAVALWVRHQGQIWGSPVAWWAKVEPSWFHQDEAWWELWDGLHWSEVLTNFQGDDRWQDLLSAGVILPVIKENPKPSWPVQSPWNEVWESFPSTVAIQTLNLQTLRSLPNTHWPVKPLKVETHANGWKISVTPLGEHHTARLAVDWTFGLSHPQWFSQLPIPSNWLTTIQRLPSYHLFVCQARMQQTLPSQLYLSFLDKHLSPVGCYPQKFGETTTLRLFFLAPESYGLESHETSHWLNLARQWVRKHWQVKVTQWDRVEVIPYAWVHDRKNLVKPVVWENGCVFASSISSRWPHSHWLLEVLNLQKDS